MLGLIMGASGLGALTSSLLIVPLVQRVPRVGWVLTGAILWSGCWLGVLALSHVTWLSVVGMFLCSLGSPVVNTTATGLLQVLAPEAMCGRLMGIWLMVSFGSPPLIRKQHPVIWGAVLI